MPGAAAFGHNLRQHDADPPGRTWLSVPTVDGRPMRLSVPLLFGGLLISGLPAAEPRPDILIITTDDQGYADLSCMGSQEIRTPHLDALAARGALCLDFYSNSPVCSPSRAALLTGRHPSQAGVPRILASTRNTPGLRPRIATLSSVLASQGYATFLSGKWHLGSAKGSRPGDHGFERTFGFLGGFVDYYSHLYWGTGGPMHDLWENDAEIWRNGEYLTDLITDQALSAIEAADARPFFGYVAYSAPHYPLHVPAEVESRFSGLPPERRIMAAMLAVVDDGVGRIVQRLKELGRLENTLIFFMSDNGPSRENRNRMQGGKGEFLGGSAAPFRGAKFSLWEGGIRVPGIFSWPAKIPAGQRISTPLAAVDVFPTVLSAARVAEAVPGLAGKDLLPLLENRETLAPRDLHWEHEGSLAIRRGDWKLLFPGEKGETLVNLKTDPGEKKNLRLENPRLAEELKRAAFAWRDGLAQP